jgi:gliding motility-associated-like protein
MVQWGMGELITCDPDCDIIEVLPSESQQLNFTATSTAGCIALDSINVTVEIFRKVYIPNVFSPNRDGVNDFFAIYAKQPNVEIIETLMIYDRWGGLVYSNKGFPPNQAELAWDGTKDSKTLQSGVYTYVTSVRFLDGEVVIYSGNVTLVE